MAEPFDDKIEITWMSILNDIDLGVATFFGC